MSLLHISDLHYLRDFRGKGDIFSSIFERMTPPLEQLRNLCSQLDTEPDAVLITGDLTHSGEEADYRALRAGLFQIFPHASFFAVPGNHDEGNAFMRGFLDLPPTLEGYFFLAPCHDLLVAGIDSSAPMTPDGAITETHCNWLETALRDAPPLPVFFMTHHHLLAGQFPLPPAVYPKRMEEMIKTQQIAALLSGHTHHFYQGTFAGKPYLASDSLSFKGINLGEGRVRFIEQGGAILYTCENGSFSVKRILSQDEPKILGQLQL
ncbi:MAG: metallophosphoesterase [Oscillospiraceae bacterium]|jgi:3',5'-cyclic AMP phosphodiesterase CpdA|nr:metallophosphoesterase [Oscillospiraceae bacterium]